MGFHPALKHLGRHLDQLSGHAAWVSRSRLPSQPLSGSLLGCARRFRSLKGGVWISIFSCPDLPSSLTFMNFRCLSL